MPLLGEPSGVPSGTIAIWTGLISTIPSGWALCDGSNGTPDLRSKFPKCVPTVGTNPGATGGSETVTLIEAQIPSHSHDLFVPDHEHKSSDDSEGQSGPAIGGTPLTGSSTVGEFLLPISSTHLVGAITSTGSGLPHNNVPRCKDVLYIQRL